MKNDVSATDFAVFRYFTYVLCIQHSFDLSFHHDHDIFHDIEYLTSLVYKIDKVRLSVRIYLNPSCEVDLYNAKWPAVCTAEYRWMSFCTFFSMVTVFHYIRRIFGSDGSSRCDRLTKYTDCRQYVYFVCYSALSTPVAFRVGQSEVKYFVL